MAAWHYDLFLVATGSVEAEALKSRLSRDLPALKSPSQKLLLWGAVEGDRIDFWSDHEPAQLLARFDLRSPSESFRRLVLELAREFSFQLLNADDVEIAADDAALLADMRSSSAQAAATNPPDDDDEEVE
jgi:hypothetical protein